MCTDTDSQPNERKASVMSTLVPELEDFAKKLPEELLVPSNQIRILNGEAIGHGTVLIFAYVISTHGNVLYVIQVSLVWCTKHT